MKKSILAFVAALFAIQTVHATVRTLCNMPYSPGQFTTFTAAHTAALPGDTIYVHGSSLSYGTVTITKPLTIIGAGHNPAKQAPLPSIFTSITLNIFGGSFSMIGITMQGLALNGASNTIVIKRCKFTEFSNGPPAIGITFGGAQTNVIIEACVFLAPFLTPPSANINFNGLPATNTFIRNNVFSRDIAFNGLTTFLTFFIENNLFLGQVNAFTSLTSCTINNNIFYRSSPQGAPGGPSNNVMNNNISFSCPINTFSAPGTNNLVNVNPLFTSFPLAGATFDYTHDYRLAAGSPGLLNGTDGTDRGVFGAIGFRFNMTGEPAMAEIFSFQITSATTIAPGGTLDISVTSKRVK